MSASLTGQPSRLVTGAGESGFYPGPPQPGHYTLRAKSREEAMEPKWVKCAVRCPYCERQLFEKDRPARHQRIARIDGSITDGFKVIVQSIPDTHRVLACGKCRQMFTLPKELI